MTLLPQFSSDEELIAFIDAWAMLLEAEDYDGAFAYTGHVPEMGWTPSLMREVIKAYGEAKPGQKVTFLGEPTDITQRKKVSRYESGSLPRIGYIWYDLNIDGFASDLTATFDVEVVPDGLAVF